MEKNRRAGCVSPDAFFQTPEELPTMSLEILLDMMRLYQETSDQALGTDPEDPAAKSMSCIMKNGIFYLTQFKGCYEALLKIRNATLAYRLQVDFTEEQLQ